MEWPKFIAHRGASAIAPENTIKALELAISLGAKCIEFDVQPTGDKQLLVFHDINLQRAASNPAKVIDLNLQQLLQIQALYDFGAQQPTIYLADFKQYLHVLLNHDVLFNCELKCFHQQNGVHTVDYVEPYLPELNKCDHKCLITSSCKDCIAQVSKLNKDLKKGIVSYKITDEVMDFAVQQKLTSISVNHKTITDKIIQKTTDSNIALMAYTINNYEYAY